MARVFDLGPRVGKVNVHGAKGMLGQEIIQHITRLNAQQAKVSKTDTLTAFAELTHAAEQAFHAQKIALGMALSVLQEKAAVATADLQLGGLLLGKEFL